MRSFRKNVFRLALKNRSSLLGALLIIALGIFVLVSFFDVFQNLEDQISDYYRDSCFGEVFATVTGIGEAELMGLEDIPGIAEASGRIAGDFRLISDLSEKEGKIVSVHLLSYDREDRENLPEFSAGAPEEGEILLGERMEDSYHYPRGTELRLLVEGKSHSYSYRGSFRQPDYIYSVPPSGSMVPDGSSYDIAMIEKSDMQKLLGTENLTELSFRLEPGIDFQDIRHELEERLAPYGLQSILERKDQSSNNRVQEELEELEGTGTLIPLIFLMISVFMLYIVLRKMLERERMLIGGMKALGLSDRELISSYLFLGLGIGFFGALLGSFFAGFFGRYIFSIYCQYFNLPEPKYRDILSSRIFSLLLASGAAVFAVFFGVKEILRISPAAAMRQQSGGKQRVFRMAGLERMLPTLFDRLAARSMLRNPFRSSLIVLAVAFSFSLSSALFSFPEVLKHMLDTEFVGTESYDIQMELWDYQSPERVAGAGEELSGARVSEAISQLPAVFYKGSRKEYSIVTGLNPGSSLRRILDRSGRHLSPPENGVILSESLAKKLHASAGERVELELSGVRGGRRKVLVTEVVSEEFGSGAYLALSAFPDVLGIDGMANKLLLKAAPGERERLRESVRGAKRLRWVADMQEVRESYERMLKSTSIMMNAFAFMSFLAAGILIYQISMINIRERRLELVTLRLMGSSRGELGRMLFIEQLLLLLLGLLLGLPGNYMLRRLLELSMQSSSYSISFHFYLMPSLSSAFFCLLISLYSWRSSVRLILKTALTEALKERE